MKLLIVESPAKTKTISKFLGKGFKVVSTFGHIMDLPSSSMGILIDLDKKKFIPEYVVIEGKEKVISELKKLSKKADAIYLASDPDREGEIISWHVQNILNDAKSRTWRVTFNEITKEAVNSALSSPREISDDLVEAQQARRILDRIVGYEVSPILWRKIRRGLSAGRVQSVALLLICRREREIENFIPKTTWSVHVDARSGSGLLKMELAKISGKKAVIEDEALANEIAKSLKGTELSIGEVKEREKKKKPLPPFMTSTLQQAAYNRLNFSVSKTMTLAQRLYEGVELGESQTALITYMRTDSLRIADSALKAARDYIKTTFGDKYLPSKPNKFSKKGAQDAHEAIRPVDVRLNPEFVERHVDRDLARLYRLIWNRFVASQMEDARYLTLTITASAQVKGKKLLLKASSSTKIFDGFTKIYAPEESEESEILPKPPEIGSKLLVEDTQTKKHVTQPPPRYTEASLVKELEKDGVGRPSTYATILSTIQKRGYVEKDKKKRFIPTQLGLAVNEMLTENLPEIFNVKFTAGMEGKLDEIAAGKAKKDDVLYEFYVKFAEDIARFRDSGGKHVTVTELKCPKCGAPLVIRHGRHGDFLGCSNFPECKFTAPFERVNGKIVMVERKPREKLELKTVEKKCPKCGANLVIREGRFGKFLSCPNFPKCKHTEPIKLEKLCPRCGSDLILRKSGKGEVWRCDKCKLEIDPPVAVGNCPKCNSKVAHWIPEEERGVCANPECDAEWRRNDVKKVVEY